MKQRKNYMKLKFMLSVLVVGLVINVLQTNFIQNNSSTPAIPIVGSEKEEIFANVKEKLHNHQNTYKVSKPVTLIPQAFAESREYDDLSAYAVIDYATGNVLADKNLEKKLPIASLTKIMTAIVVLDLANPDEKFSVSQKAAGIMPTKIGVDTGELLTVEELLNATLLTSANDAAEVIKEGIDVKYDDEIFIRAMNEKAQFIGLKNTHFDNPQGFDGENYSSVHDYAILTHYALTYYPLISHIVAKESEFLPDTDHHKRYFLPNWNGLIGVYPNTIGVKIGNTRLAAKTTAVVAERNGKRVLAIALGAPDVLKRDLWTAQLLDLGFQEKYGLEPVKVTEDQLRSKYAMWDW